MVRLNPLPPTKRLCLVHGAQKTLAVRCDGERCTGFVKVPIGSGKYWCGCVHVLRALSAAVAVGSKDDLTLDVLLHENL